MVMELIIYGYRINTEQKINNEPDCNKNIIHFNMLPNQLREFQSKYLGKIKSWYDLVSVWACKTLQCCFWKKTTTAGITGGYFDRDRLYIRFYQHHIWIIFGKIRLDFWFWWYCFYLVTNHQDGGYELFEHTKEVKKQQ